LRNREKNHAVEWIWLEKFIEISGLKIY